MSDEQGTAIAERPAVTASTVKMPPGPRLPKLVQGIGYALSRNRCTSTSPAATATCSP